MTFRHLVLSVLCLALAAPASAQIYRWVDSKGKVHFSDSPPPDTKRLQAVKAPSRPVDGQSAQMKEAVAKAPVTLYITDCGPACSQSVALLQSRGIPHSALRVDQDPEAAKRLKQVAGVLQVPVMTVGGTVQKGFQAELWHKLLDVAGYPKADTTAGKEPQ